MNLTLLATREIGGQFGGVGSDEGFGLDQPEMFQLFGRKVRQSGVVGHERFQHFGQPLLILRRKLRFGFGEEGVEALVHGGRIAGMRGGGKFYYGSESRPGGPKVKAEPCTSVSRSAPRSSSQRSSSLENDRALPTRLNKSTWLPNAEKAKSLTNTCS